MSSLFGCATLEGIFGKKDSGRNEISGPYFEAGRGGEGLRLAILSPQIENVSETFNFLPDIIQGSLNEDFSKFSAITIFDRQHLDDILKEQDISLSGNFSQDTEIKIGNLQFQEYALFGRLTGIPGGYYLNLMITNLQSGEQKAVYNGQFTAKEIKSGAVKKASPALLAGMGVILTPNGKIALEAAAQTSAEAQTNLAMSRAAGRKGNTVEELIYAYGAVDRNASISGAAAQLNAVAAEMTSGGTGVDIRNDVEWRNRWKSQLTGFEVHYDEHPPFDIVYTPAPVPYGPTNYEKNTADYEFMISLQPSGGIQVMQKVLRDLLKGLNKTKNRKKWGFSAWPNAALQSNVFVDKNYTIEAALLNDSDESIRNFNIVLSSQLMLKGTSIRFDSVQRLPVRITGLNVNDLTADMKVRLLRINGMNVDEAEENGYWVIRETDQKKMPKAKRATIPAKERYIAHPEIAQKKAPKPQPEPQYKPPKPAAPPKPAREAPPLQYRFGISGDALFSPVAGIDTATAGLTFDLGIKSFAMEGMLIWPMNAGMYDAPGLDSMRIFSGGGGLGYTLVTQHLLSTLSGGVIYTAFQNDEKVFAPYGQLKFDIMPWKLGLGLRLGFMAEMGSLDWGPAYQRYFNDIWAFNAGDSLRINGRIMTGLVLWL
jgi:hypothetical protein